MSFPAPSISPPSLSLYQLSYQGVSFGGVVYGATYQLVSITGLDMPPVASGDVQRPLDEGEFMGLDLSAGRDFTVTTIVRGSTAAALETARQALEGAMWVAGNTEAPLFIHMASNIYGIMCRPRKFNFTLDLNMVQGFGGVVTMVFHMTDPRVYASPTLSTNVPLPVSGTGYTFPLTFPHTYGGGSAGVATVLNAGNVEMRPVLVFTGPLLTPIAYQLSLPNNPQIGFAVNMLAGDTLTIDTDFQSAVYRPGGAGSGYSVRNLELMGTTWFVLPKGSSTIGFSASSGSGTLSVQSASAFAGL
jgi:hypothetical protein